MESDALNPCYPSPDGEHMVRLAYEHELRFGPALFRLEIDQQSFGERCFWNHVFWSPDSQWVVLSECLGRYDSEGTDYWKFNQLVVMNVVKRREGVLAEYNQGWLIPREVTEDRILYFREPRPGMRLEYERAPGSVTGWKAWP